MGYQDHDYRKPKNAPKKILPYGDELEKKVMETIDTVASLVGSTLGPHGRTVLIERPEPGLPPFQTKDGVTVARSLGFEDPVKQVVLEAFRDAAVKTVESAGDGTSSATVLAQAILKNMSKYLKANKNISPQLAVREMNSFFDQVCVPYISSQATKVNAENYNQLLLTVAKVSTNGDQKLSEYVLQAFNMVGDGGHITLAEESGSYGFEILKTQGYPFQKGYEESCAMFSNEFINDQNNGRIFLEKAKLILIDGNVLDMSGLGRFFELVQQEYQKNPTITPNYIVMAHGFNKQVLARLAKIQKSAFKIIPCLTPMDALPNSRHDFLRDMAALTGGRIFNSIDYPVSGGVPQDLGQPVVAFEMQRFRSVIHGMGNEKTIIERVNQLTNRKNSAATSRFEKSILEERIGRLTGGIAKLVVRDISDSQIRETKDRAEDAICAIRGAAKHGVLPGGGRILLDLSLMAADSGSEVVKQVLAPSFSAPILRILENAGLADYERKDILENLVKNQQLVYNAATGQLGDAMQLQLLDSVPAVLEATRAALSISSLLGTLGGVCVYARDNEADISMAEREAELRREMQEHLEETELEE